MNTIFRNLISNAIKFTKNFGAVDVISTIRTCELSRKKFIDVSVIDDGVGMDEKLVNNLFQIEKKTVKPGTNKEMGTGLGLVLCKEFIQKHAGTISVKSAKDVGSTFTISIPV
jgi:two-component system sensor histidine kinase/response regulator